MMNCICSSTTAHSSSGTPWRRQTKYLAIPLKYLCISDPDTRWFQKRDGSSVYSGSTPLRMLSKLKRGFSSTLRLPLSRKTQVLVSSRYPFIILHQKCLLFGLRGYHQRFLLPNGCLSIHPQNGLPNLCEVWRLVLLDASWNCSSYLYVRRCKNRHK